MAHRSLGVAIVLLTTASAAAQQPTPLFTPSPGQPNPPAAASPEATAADRVFCDQDVAYHLADPASVLAPYRPFLGVFSDAAWTPQLCAALIVESIANDGTARITYAFGPMGSGNLKPGGVLHGTGVIQGGELKFQNSDGSQYSFKPFYSDLNGHWTTPRGEGYDAVFKRTY